MKIQNCVELSWYWLYHWQLESSYIFNEVVYGFFEFQQTCKDYEFGWCVLIRNIWGAIITCQSFNHNKQIRTLPIACLPHIVPHTTFSKFKITIRHWTRDHATGMFEKSQRYFSVRPSRTVSGALTSTLQHDFNPCKDRFVLIRTRSLCHDLDSCIWDNMVAFTDGILY